MSTRTQQGKYQMMVRVDIYYNTIDVKLYPCQLVPMSAHTTKRCQLVPSSDVNSYPARHVSDGITQQMSTRTIITCQLVPNIK